MFESTIRIWTGNPIASPTNGEKGPAKKSAIRVGIKYTEIISTFKIHHLFS